MAGLTGKGLFPLFTAVPYETRSRSSNQETLFDALLTNSGPFLQQQNQQVKHEFEAHVILVCQQTKQIGF